MTLIGNEKRGKRFTLKARLNSFKGAFSGIKLLLKYEHNFRIHIVVLLIVIVSGLLLKLALSDWLAIIIVSGMVLVAESFNTALEYLSDSVSTERVPSIKGAKDTAAAGVLIASIIAILTGALIFIPRICTFIRFTSPE